MDKKISVIIPCYNASDFLDRCLRSLEAQTIGFEALECICVDDASVDDTRDLLAQWERRYPENMIVIPLEENVRQGQARNIALSYATCDRVAFLDADDWLEPDFFSVLYEKTAEHDYDMISCGLKRDPSTSLSYFEERSFTVPQTEYHITGDAERKAFFHAYPLSYTACGRLIRRSFLAENEIVFPDGLAYEDTFFGALCSIHANHVRIVGEYLYHYYVNDASTVLKMDAGYHIDLLTVQELLWQEFGRRGFTERFPDELQYEYLFSCCLAFWKVIILRYHTPPYSLYRLLCAISREKIAGFEQNPYVRAGTLREHYKLMIQSLLTPLTKSQFERFAGDIRKIGL